MPSEAQMEHPPMALLVGSVPCPLEAQTGCAVEAGWRFSHVGDIYAAMAALLRTDRPRPDAVLVLAESLRGDESRFFDVLARRWPGLPAGAVCCVSPEDRRLEACRRRGVAVLAAQAVAGWLGHQRPPELPGPGVAPASPGEKSPSAALGATPAVPVAQPPSAVVPAPVPPVFSPEVLDPPSPPAGVEVTLDLPDELADLSDLDETQAEPVDHTEYGPADLPDGEDEPGGPQAADGKSSPDAVASRANLDEVTDLDEGGDGGHDLSPRVPLTPWSDVPRPERRRPERRSSLRDRQGQPGPSAAVDPADVSPPGAKAAGQNAQAGSLPETSGGAAPTTGNGKPASSNRSSTGSGWEHGLLTPEELRALLQESDDVRSGAGAAMSTVAASGTIASVLVIGPEAVAQALQASCSQERIDRVDDVLAGLEQLGSGGIRTVFVWTASLPGRAAAALSAMRELLAPGAGVYLVARPEEEPQARSLAVGEAVDYMIWPLQKSEIARVLGVRPGRPEAPRQAEVVAAPDVGLTRLAEAIGAAGADLSACLDRVTAAVAEHLHARGCTIELPEMMSICGEAIGEPVLAVDLDLGGGRKGRLAVGPRHSGAYAAADAVALQGYGVLVATVCRLALEASHWRQEAQTDGLTGLLNRRGLELKLPVLLARARRQRTTVTVLLFDMDDFKHYNDAYGHNVGDEILRETGQLFVRHCRKHDLVARYGGDEFVVVFWEADEPRVAGSKPPRDVLAVLTRFRKALERHEFSSLGPEAQGVLTISGGLVTFPWEAGSAGELIARADEALLHAKRQGKNRIWLVGQGSR